jgi:polar amino acid transport system substrate-binding protein
MRRSPVALFPALVSILASLAVQSAEAQPLNLFDTVWPPYFLESEEAPGFGREILVHCVEEVGRVPRFARVDLQDMYKALQLGALDVHIMSRKPEREAYAVFGAEPVFRDGYRPAVRRGSGIEIDSIADFDRLRMGHLEGLKYSEEFLQYVTARYQRGDLEVATSNEGLLDLLLEGRVDVVVTLESTARWLAKREGVGDRVEVLPFDIRTSEYFFAVSKSSSRVPSPSELLAALDGCVRQLKVSGRYAEMQAKYGLEG